MIDMDYCRRLAQVYLDAPDFTEEEALLEAACNRAAERTGIDMEALIAEVAQGMPKERPR